jgi:hypothetical protein
VAQTDLPIACTLGPADGRDRIARWRALHDLGTPVVTREPSRLEARYDGKPGVREELAELVAAESQCCGFVEWSATEVGGVPTLVVTAPTDQPDALDAIVALLEA